MSDAATLLTALQYADSFFPGGGTAFSWGLEALCTDRQVTSPEDVRCFLEGQLRHRWATCDRPFLVAAHRASADIDAVVALDRMLEAMTLARELREGATRAGGALLGVHERLGTAGAAAYRRRVRAGEAPGHLPVVQGLLLAGVGLDAQVASAVSAHALAVGIVSAGLRLSAITHVDAQRILSAVRGLLAELLDEHPADVAQASVYAPATDVAAMRHESQTARLFAN